MPHTATEHNLSVAQVFAAWPNALLLSQCNHQEPAQLIRQPHKHALQGRHAAITLTLHCTFTEMYRHLGTYPPNRTLYHTHQSQPIPNGHTTSPGNNAAPILQLSAGINNNYTIPHNSCLLPRRNQRRAPRRSTTQHPYPPSPPRTARTRETYIFNTANGTTHKHP